MKKYQPSQIEPKWQKKWQENHLYATDLKKDNKFYVLAEFAYPSGDLHVGHWFTFTGADIFARLRRMQGFNVFFPNGFDSFGLPAEGAAIKRNIHPKDWTESNIARMKEQFLTLGPSFDFYGDLASHKPQYYRWNQWIFLKMFDKGLAYRGKYLANWCPNDQTVLANEAVEAGKCWRCGAEVIQKEVEQWFFRITDYADRLIWPENPTVDWPISVRESQNEWIGRSEGALVEFKIDNSEAKISVFTTRLDTIYGATFLVIAPEHPLAQKLINSAQKLLVQDYLKHASKKSELERKENKQKSGVFTGSYAINPFNNQLIEIWIADYVLPGYGTGAVMAVPAHDDRDFEFAKKFKLPITQVIEAEDGQGVKMPFLNYGKLINSADYTGLSSKQAQSEMLEYLVQNKIGEGTVNYHIHDWSISRQRYWGTPIPIIHCDHCGMVPVPEKDLPVELPYEVDYQPKGKSPLASNEQWLKVKCPNCGQNAKRDADTMDTFVDSSWYFFRYLDTNLETAPFDTDLSKKIMPVDIYFGGAEHTLGHTLYSRYFTKFFHDLGLTDLQEYAQRRINHGIVLGPDGQKMSKSRGNVVNPDDEVKKFGADAVRLHVAFFMPYEGVGPWISERIWGPYHFLERLWGLFDKVTQQPAASHSLNKQDLLMLNKTVKKVQEDIENIKFNTAIAAMMEWLNYLSRKNTITQTEYQVLLQLLAPFAPHISEELWYELGNKTSIHTSEWPKVDEVYLQADVVTVVVQVNGKVRENLSLDHQTVKNQSEVEKEALKSEKVQKFLANSKPKKVIYVPGKLLNLVI